MPTVPKSIVLRDNDVLIDDEPIPWHIAPMDEGGCVILGNAIMSDGSPVPDLFRVQFIVFADSVRDERTGKGDVVHKEQDSEAFGTPMPVDEFNAEWARRTGGV